MLSIALFACSLSSIPYWVAKKAETSEWVFNGAVFDRQDVAIHLATMQSGAQGDWVYRVMVTTELQQGAYIKLAYIFLGHLASWLGIDVMEMYHLGRILFGLAACLAIYTLAAASFSEMKWRRLAYVIALFGSGLGWLQLGFGWLPQPDISPVDFWLIDSYPFFGLVVLPHFSLVTALITVSLAAYIHHLRRPRARLVIFIGLAVLILQCVQPYAPVLLDLGMVGALCADSIKKSKLDRRQLFTLIGLGIAQLPLLAYTLLVFQSDPVWAEFQAQNITLSPPITYYLYGFGLLWPLALFGAWISIRKPAADKGAALAWVTGALMMAYLPTALQRRFMHAYLVPLAFLAVHGLRQVIYPWFCQAAAPAVFRRRGYLVIVYITAVSISSLYLVAGTSLVLQRRPADLYDPASLVDAIDWLKAAANRGEAVLSSEQTGQLVAAQAGLPVYLGHPIETMNYPVKARQVAQFFRNPSTGDLLRDARIQWIVWGPYERELGPVPADVDWLQPAYQAGDVVIFRVVR